MQRACDLQMTCCSREKRLTSLCRSVLYWPALPLVGGLSMSYGPLSLSRPCKKAGIGGNVRDGAGVPGSVSAISRGRKEDVDGWAAPPRPSNKGELVLSTLAGAPPSAAWRTPTKGGRKVGSGGGSVLAAVGLLSWKNEARKRGALMSVAGCGACLPGRLRRPCLRRHLAPFGHWPEIA